MRLGFRLVESLYPPNQPLNGGNPIENLTGNLKRKFQVMIVSFDTIIVNRLRVFSNLKSTRERVSTPTCPDLPRPAPTCPGRSRGRRRGRNRWEKSSARPYPRFASTFFS